MSNFKNKPVMEVKDLTKRYGHNRGIENVGFEVEKGDLFGFIGPNGAGKSTTIRTVLGLISPDSGEVKIFGEDALKKGAELRKRIGFVPSELNYYDGLTVRDLLFYSASFYKSSNPEFRKKNSVKERIENYSERLKLDLSRKIIDLSLGNRKKVAIIQALIHSPELIILDEPTSGLDPLIQSRFYEILREEQERGTTIFFSSHTLSEVERLCNKVAIIRDGSIITVSRIDRLKRLYLKKFRLVFESSEISEIRKNLEKIEDLKEIKFEGNSVEGYFSGNINKFLKTLVNFPDSKLKDIVLEDPGLEEIFMHYYSDESENTENGGER